MTKVGLILYLACPMYQYRVPQVVDATYLKPKFIELASYTFIRIGVESDFYEGFVRNEDHHYLGNGNGNDFLVFHKKIET